MDSIAKKLNITKPALYHHFKDKKDLYFSAVDNSFDGLMTEIKNIFVSKTKEPRKKLFEMSEVYLGSGMKRKSFTKIITHWSYNKKDSVIYEYLVRLRTRTIKIFEKIIKEIHEEKGINERRPKDDAILLIGAIDGIMMNASFSEKKKTIKKQLKEIVSMISKVDK